MSHSLFVAVQHNSLEDVKQIIQDNPDLTFYSNTNGQLPLFYAVLTYVETPDEHADKLEIIRRMSKQLSTIPGEHINDQDIVGNTPLSLAAKKGYVDIIDILIEYGADVNSKGCDGKTPLHIATTENQSDAVKTLIRYGADWTIIDDAERIPLDIALYWFPREQGGVKDILLNPEEWLPLPIAVPAPEEVISKNPDASTTNNIHAAVACAPKKTNDAGSSSSIRSSSSSDDDE